MGSAEQRNRYKLGTFKVSEVTGNVPNYSVLFPFSEYRVLTISRSLTLVGMHSSYTIHRANCDVKID